MELEILARIYKERTAQVVDGRLLAWQLVQVPSRHITTEIQLAEVAPANRKAAARVEFSEDCRISC
jgi:hypothetical protein